MLPRSRNAQAVLQQLEMTRGFKQNTFMSQSLGTQEDYA